AARVAGRAQALVIRIVKVKVYVAAGLGGSDGRGPAGAGGELEEVVVLAPVNAQASLRERDHDAHVGGGVERFVVVPAGIELVRRDAAARRVDVQCEREDFGVVG